MFEGVVEKTNLPGMETLLPEPSASAFMRAPSRKIVPSDPLKTNRPNSFPADTAV